MSRETDFIKKEKDYWGKIYVDISYAIDNVSPFIGEQGLKKRKYYMKKDVLKKYIDILTSAEQETNKSGVMNFFSGHKYEDLINSYKSDNRATLAQLEHCSGCACLNCTSECSFDSCLGCRTTAFIGNCDHKKINVIFHENYYLDLQNDSTGENDRYIVLATLQDVELDRRYIIIKNTHSDDKFVLYYYAGTSEDSYGEIQDGEELDYIVSTFQSAEK